jgi:hypothetical protein
LTPSPGGARCEAEKWQVVAPDGVGRGVCPRRAPPHSARLRRPTRRKLARQPGAGGRPGLRWPVGGHDLHITAGLGAAGLMSKNTDAWSGTYIALFQPGEQTAAGARSMVEDGLRRSLAIHMITVYG